MAKKDVTTKASGRKTTASAPVKSKPVKAAATKAPARKPEAAPKKGSALKPVAAKNASAASRKAAPGKGTASQAKSLVRKPQSTSAKPAAKKAANKKPVVKSAPAAKTPKKVAPKKIAAKAAPIAKGAAKVPAQKPAPARPTPKASAKKPSVAPQKPVAKTGKQAASKPAPPVRKAPVKAQAKAPAKAQPKVAAKAPEKAGTVKTAGKKKLLDKALVQQQTPQAAQAVMGQIPSLFETTARKLAVKKTQAKRMPSKLSATGESESPKPVRNALDTYQPTGMYSGILVAHEVKPFPEKTPYSQEELKKLQDALMEERERLLNQLNSLNVVSMDAMVSAKENAAYSVHQAEHATDLQTAEANMGVRSIEEDRLEQVDQALARINNNANRYGLCLACGNKIGIQRLIARPHAHLCMPCRKRYETIRSRRSF